MATVIIPLPYSRPPLSMNDGGITRGARMARARTISGVRADSGKLARKHRLPTGLAHVTVQLHYRPRDNRRRDTDNLVATLKPLCDGLAAGTRTHPGYGLVPDDTPEFMAKPEPRIHPAQAGLGGELWLEITWEAA